MNGASEFETLVGSESIGIILNGAFDLETPVDSASIGWCLWARLDKSKHQLHVYAHVMKLACMYTHMHAHVIEMGILT